ncbi:MAG: hypothetical protein ACRETS_13430, partial [Steroidobacteraceae bacterium]
DQIAPHSPVTAIAGELVGSQAPSATPSWFDQRYAPRLSDVQAIMQGEDLLNPNWAKAKGTGVGLAAGAPEIETGKGALKGGMPMPPDAGPTGLRARFSQAAGDMFRDRPQLADNYYSVFKDAYASLLAQSGNISGQDNPTLRTQALQIALGNRVQFGPNTVSVPRGMDPSGFSGYVHDAVATSVSQLYPASEQKGPPEEFLDQIRGYGLEEVGGVGAGRYRLTMGNVPILQPGTNRPIVVDLRDQYLGARGLHRGEPNFNAPPEVNVGAGIL